MSAHNYDHETPDDMTEANQRLVVDGHLFAYYPRVGGLIVSSQREVIDAGIIGTPGPIDAERLGVIARSWLTWREAYRIQRKRMGGSGRNRPAEEDG